ncbi:GNAT family N-acetyltransferase [Spirosoma pollinicola]|uniref:N-acetyltransferase n=1 Tax=Spirosoma pollinicola TaxID=2057025 RepID=A0A2K8Z390_9BACT|nr:GNAT family N-acetyltransferase [Spirosoma pollinicola]AUD04332.1 N-acetyltransferase [Spirosoma pollinicola]
MKIRSVQLNDWSAMAAIYQQGIDTGNATMETRAPLPEAMANAYMTSPQLVAVEAGTVIGYALLTAVSGRCVFSGVAEVSLYVDAAHRGKGVGQQLLNQLIIESETKNLWTLQASIFPENTASIALHKRCGFREIGHHERIGKRAGIWRNILLLERRSTQVGID